MIGAVLYEMNRPLRVESEIDLPALRRGQVLVEIAYSGLCHSQVMEARGGRGDDKYLPHLLGHEASGVVREIGEGVLKVKKNDRVILGWIKGSGIEAGGSVYSCRGHKINSGAITTFSTVSIVSENRLTPLPANLPMDVAVLFGCALLTGAGMVTQQLRPPPESKIAVLGLGGIGLSALMAANLTNPSQLIAIDVNDDKLEIAREFGATHVINAKNGDVSEEVRKLTGGDGVDFCVEAAGLARTIELAFGCVRRGGGRAVFASHPASGEKISLDPYEMICGKRIEGSWGGGTNPDLDIPAFSKLFAEGKLPLRKLLSKRYALEQINDAIDDLANQRVSRPLIEINPQLA